MRNCDGEEKSKQLNSVKEKLLRKITFCNVHAVQLLKQRSSLNRIISEELDMNTALVYMDFIGHSNRKIHQLVFYLKFYNNDSLEDRRISVWGEGAHDSEYVCRAWKLVMEQTSYFENINVIYVARDNGSHLKSYELELLYFESSFYKLYQKELRIRALLAHHAWNQRNSWGAVSKRAV